MDGKEAREYVKTIGERGMILGLARMQKLMELLGNPQRNLKFVHVAGTNGKGSVIAFLSEILQQAGCRVGVYTSPAVFDELEIYRINHRKISDEKYTYWLERMKAAADEMKRLSLQEPTLFEIQTALAFCYFAAEGCDLVLLETGLGGREDATNCIPVPVCAVITPISREHCAILGDDVREIAGHKSGIIKEGTIVVSSSQQAEAAEVIREKCARTHASLIMVRNHEIKSQRWKSQQGTICRSISYHGINSAQLGLLGKYQLENAALAIETARVLGQNGYDITDRHIIKGLKEARWHGRCSVLSTKPLIMMDGAHNEHAAQALSNVLREDYPQVQWIFVMGVLQDKAYEPMVQILAPFAERCITVTSASQRALPGEQLGALFVKYGCGTYCALSVKEAVRQALDWCGQYENGGVLAFGSFTFLKEFQAAVDRAENRNTDPGDQVAQAAAVNAGLRIMDSQDLNSRMPLVSRIMENSLFLQKMEQLEQLEQNRQFCHHGWQHSMDVARGTALLNEERKLGYEKELLYATALLHDIGRGEQYLHQVSHEQAGALLAEQILQQCGCSEEQRAIIVGAVRGHRQQESEKGSLAALLAEADKKTRPCYNCGVWKECNWPEERKNRTVEL